MMLKLRFKGYTLIELLVAISILSLLFMVGFAAFNSYNRRQKLTTSGEEIVSILRDLQNKAMSGEKDSVLCSDSVSRHPLRGWKFIWTSGNQYSYKGVCYDENDFLKADIYFFPSNVFTLPNVDNLRFTTGGEILFKPVNEGVTSAGNICIRGDTDLGSEQYYKIIVSSAGDINVSRASSCP